MKINYVENLNNNIFWYDYNRQTINEFLLENDMYSINDLQLNTKYSIKYVYTPIDNETPYIIVQYINNKFGVIGCKVDKIMTLHELLYNGYVYSNDYKTICDLLPTQSKIEQFCECSVYTISCENIVIYHTPIAIIGIDIFNNNEHCAYYEIEKTDDYIKHIKCIIDDNIKVGNSTNIMRNNKW